MVSPIRRISPFLRALALLLLLSGAAFEYAHLQHHIEHAGHHHGHDEDLHRECLVFHDGLIAGGAPAPDLTPVPLGLADLSEATRPAITVDRRLPDTRAPPAS